MIISEKNINYISGLLKLSQDYLSHIDEVNDPAQAESLWLLGANISDMSLGFRIVRLFSIFKTLFPERLKQWYQQQVKQVWDQYKIHYIKTIAKQFSSLESKELSHYLSKTPLTPKLYHTVAAHIAEAVEKDKELQRFREEMQKHNYASNIVESAVDTFLEGKDREEIKAEAVRKKEQDNLRLSKKFALEGRAKTSHNYREPFSNLLKPFEHYMDSDTKSVLNHHCTFLTVNPSEQLDQKEKSTYSLIAEIVAELQSKPYDPSVIALSLRLLLKMTAPGIRQETLRDYLSLRIHCKAKDIEYDRINVIMEGDTIVAKARLETDISHRANTHERVAFEMTHVLGFDGIPASIRPQRGGQLQKFVPGALTLDKVISEDEKGAEKIQKLDEAETQVHLTFGMILGRQDGNKGNTIIQPQSNGRYKLFDIDEEEDFCEDNRYVRIDCADDISPIRSYPLGLPQAGKKYPRVLLKLFSWEGMKTQALKQAKASGLNARQIEALEYRLTRINEICRLESLKENSHLTPRDLYFALHGHEYAYFLLKKVGVADIDFFSELYGNEATVIRLAKEVEENKESTNATIFLKNAKALDSSLVPTFPMVGLQVEGENVLGTTLLLQVHQLLRTKDGGELFEVDPKTFDAMGWTIYKERCEKENRNVHNFMLAHFLQGYARRMASQLAYLYPLCSLDVRKEDQKSYLTLTKSSLLIELDKKLRDHLDSGQPIIVADIPKGDFNRRLYEKGIKKIASSKWIEHERSQLALECLTGQTRALITWILNIHRGDLNSQTKNILFNIDFSSTQTQLICCYHPIPEPTT